MLKFKLCGAVLVFSNRIAWSFSIINIAISISKHNIRGIISSLPIELSAGKAKKFTWQERNFSVFSSM
jgi:hypothetical protein